MKKSMYSLILGDDLVACVDRLAYERRTNRSNMINEILAEYFSYVTPEQRCREIFQAVGRLLEGQDRLRLMMEPSATLLSLQSPLVYKYNPTVKYSVELYKHQLPDVGELRVSLRTKNENLIACMTAFYRLWAETEARFLSGECVYHVQDGRLSRSLTLRNCPSEPSSETLGGVIAAYVAVLDSALKDYFACLPDTELARRRMETLYRNYLQKTSILI